MLADPVIVDDEALCHCGSVLTEDVEFWKGCRGVARQWRCRNGHSVTRREAIKDPEPDPYRTCDTCSGQMTKADQAHKRVRHQRCDAEHHRRKMQARARQDKQNRAERVRRAVRGAGKARTRTADRILTHQISMAGAFGPGRSRTPAREKDRCACGALKQPASQQCRGCARQRQRALMGKTVR